MTTILLIVTLQTSETWYNGIYNALRLRNQVFWLLNHQMIERMPSRPDKIPELLTFHLNPDECFWLMECMIKWNDYAMLIQGKKFRVKFRVWQKHQQTQATRRLCVMQQSPTCPNKMPHQIKKNNMLPQFVRIIVRYYYLENIFYSEFTGFI